VTYREVLLDLSRECERQVLAVYALYAEGTITAQEAETLIATIIAAHNSQASALADVSLATTIMLSLGREVPTAGILPPADDVARLEKSASTVLTVARGSQVPEAIVGRLARSEPLQTASLAYAEGMKTSSYVTGWVRNLSAGACQLCRWWSRDGVVWPKDHPFQSHKGCSCTPRPVVAENIQSTAYTRRLRNAG
jgi:hypothetical protein